MSAGKCFSATVPAGDDLSATICDALSAVDDFARQAAIGESAAARLAVVVEELVSNALRHGQARWLCLQLERLPDAVSLIQEDDGLAFDPTRPAAFDGPDADTGGGVGLALVRSWSSVWRYARRGARNRSELVLPLVA